LATVVQGCPDLKQLSRGAITFFDSDRHGKTLILHEQSAVHERVTDSVVSGGNHVGVSRTVETTSPR
jgi:hypothetical protein